MSDNQKKLNEQLFNVVLSDKDSVEVKLKKVKYLVRLGANVNKKVNGKSLLRIAREKGHKEIENVIKESLRKSFEKLLEGDKFDRVLDECGFAHGHKVVVSKEKAIDLGNQFWDNDGKLKSAKEIEDLIQQGADVNIQNKSGDTALIEAAFNEEMDVVKVLLAHGADVNAQENDGWTALMWAAYKESKDIVQMLLEKGADANIRNNQGSRVWDRDRCDREIVKVIKEHIKKTSGESDNDGGFLGKICGGLTR